MIAEIFAGFRREGDSEKRGAPAPGPTRRDPRVPRPDALIPAAVLLEPSVHVKWTGEILRIEPAADYEDRVRDAAEMLRHVSRPPVFVVHPRDASNRRTRAHRRRSSALRSPPHQG